MIAIITEWTRILVTHLGLFAFSFIANPLIHSHILPLLLSQVIHYVILYYLIHTDQSKHQLLLMQ